MVKLPMLLSKPKKCYKSVSKTDLMADQQNDQEEDQKIDIFAYEEMKITQDSESDEMIGALTVSVKYQDDVFDVFLKDFAATNQHCYEADKESNVCIKLELRPDSQHTAKTKPVSLKDEHGTVSINQQFNFKDLHYNRLQILSLHFKVIIDNKIIGEVVKEVRQMYKDPSDLSESQELTLHVFPPAVQEEYQSTGELLLSLCYQPAAKRLSVVVLKARNVPKMDITGFSDPYVKIYMNYQNVRTVKKKTHIKKRSLNPVFNESFIFDLPSKDGSLDEIQLEVVMCDWDRITKNEIIGRLYLGGAECVGTGLAHWEEIQKNPRRPIAQWHTLSG